MFITLGTNNTFAGSNEHTDYGFGASNSSISSDDYKLHQNYPNPFNPVTRVSYKMSKDGFVSLKIYNLVGQELITLVNEYQKAGSYNVRFDGSDLTTGIYIYKLQVNDFSSVKRMTLIK